MTVWGSELEDFIPEGRARQVTHLALTLELLFLLEGQGAGEHCACVVEAVLDHMLVLVCEPGERAGVPGEGSDDLKLSSRFSFLPFLQKALRDSPAKQSSPLLGLLTAGAAWARFLCRRGTP